ncbi:efflux RND transporter permease subunit [Opitutaceae bacterium]
MVLSDLSIKRPVICLVVSFIILLIGGIAFMALPVREYPSTDSPIISVGASYRGASAEVVEAKVTEVLEKEVATIEGIKLLRSFSSEGSSRISIEFLLSRDIDEAANDVRDRVSRAIGRLPQEVENAQVSKTDADSDPILSLSFNSDRYNRLELTEMVDRIAIQRIQTVPGVGAVELQGQRYAMRLWVNSDKLAAYNLTVTDVRNALRQQNVDLPSGRIESLSREFPVRLQGAMSEPSAYENLVLATRGNYQVKFSDVGRVELGREDYRRETVYNGRPTVGVSIVRQAQSNLLDVANSIKAMLPSIQADLPEGVQINIANDTSIFVERSVNEVYKTLWEALGLVVLMIFLFLRDWRATIIPILAIPVSIIGTFAVMSAMGFSINVLTLLALVLAVGLVVDDAIVMLENIYRRIEEGEQPIPAAIHGARQVAFAIIATTLTLIAVFMPVAFQKGQTGRLFYEFGITLAVAVSLSGFVALTLAPMLCSRMLKVKMVNGHAQHGWFYEKTEPFFVWLNRSYERMLHGALRAGWLVLGVVSVFTIGSFYLYTKLQREITPLEDRGVFNVNFNGPIGATPEYVRVYSTQMDEMIRTIPEVERTFHNSGFGTSAFINVALKPWEERTRTTQEIIAEVRSKFAQQITGGQANATPVRPFGGGGGGGRGGGGGIQMVLQGSNFDELQKVGQDLVAAARQGTMISNPRVNPSPTKPQLNVRIDRDRAADLRVPIADIGTALETMLGGSRTTTFQRGNQQYDVLVQVEEIDRATPNDLARIYVKSQTGQLIQLSNLVTYDEAFVPENFPHFNRMRSVTFFGQIASGATIGDAVTYLEELARPLMPPGVTFAWDGEAREFAESGNDTYVLFGLALLFTFLILAAQFESWVHPITIFTGVAIALGGGILVLYCTRFWGPAMTDNIFSRFGLIMLIGLVAKNGILIVEFANQLQIQGRNAYEAAIESATVRFRPIIMTSIATTLGAVPIAFASGPGSETRNPMGIVVVGGLTIATFLTLFVVPIFYIMTDKLVVRFTGHSSAHGLKRAAEIDREMDSPDEHGQNHGRPTEPVMAK